MEIHDLPCATILSDKKFLKAKEHVLESVLRLPMLHLNKIFDETGDAIM